MVAPRSRSRRKSRRFRASERLKLCVVLSICFGVAAENCWVEIVPIVFVAPKLKIFVGDGLRRAAYFHIGSIALKDAIERIAAASAAAASATAIVTTIAAAAALVVLTWSHFLLMP